MKSISDTAAAGNGRPDSPAWMAAKAAGDSAELLLAEVLRGIGLLVRRIEGPALHDLDLAGRIEVKSDAMAARTGNLAIEVAHAGRPSGISLPTAAATWALVSDVEIILVARDTLRAMIDGGEYRTVPAAEANLVVLLPVPMVRSVGVSIQRRRR